jgi:hypothetical protein
MKLISKLTFFVLLFFAFACGGSSTEGEKKTDDTAKTETKPDEAEKKEEPKDTVKFVLTDEAKVFVNKWKLDSYTHTDGKSEKNIQGSFLSLKEDGSFEELFNANVIASGTWNVSKDQKTLTLIHKTGKYKEEFGKETEDVSVKEVSAAKLVTVDAGGKMTETYVAEKK